MLHIKNGWNHKWESIQCKKHNKNHEKYGRSRESMVQHGRRMNKKEEDEMKKEGNCTPKRQSVSLSKVTRF